MSFMTYQEVRPWAKAIREAVITSKMPPCADRASTLQISLSASAAAIARTRHSVSGATTSQHAGTDAATMRGWKL